MYQEVKSRDRLEALRGNLPVAGPSVSEAIGRRLRNSSDRAMLAR
jgi:hypothetical protein